ncbi:hypothetical protein P4S72_19470 [Vibrio sp. PP-XX7]
MFFEFAEFRAKNKAHLRLQDWREYVDKFMDFNEQPPQTAPAASATSGWRKSLTNIMRLSTCSAINWKLWAEDERELKELEAALSSA